MIISKIAKVEIGSVVSLGRLLFAVCFGWLHLSLLNWFSCFDCRTADFFQLATATASFSRLQIAAEGLVRMKVLAVAVWAVRRESDVHGEIPGMAASTADHCPLAVGRLSDAESFAFYQGLSDLFSGCGDDSAEGLARDGHSRGCLFLVQSLEVGKAQRLEFVGRKGDVHRAAPGTKFSTGGHPPYFSTTTWPWHDEIMSICS